MKKRITSLLLMLVMLATAILLTGCEIPEGLQGLLPGGDNTDITPPDDENTNTTPTYSKGLQYILSEDGRYYIVNDIGTCTDTEVIIPTTYKGLPVREIGERAFSECANLTSIIIPEGVTTIGDYAFAHCVNLTNITIPNSVTSFGSCAFYFCTSLTSIIIPEGVTTIGERVFSECANLTSIIIPEGVTTIGDYAFDWCVNLTNITIPNSVTSIGSRAFLNCTSLTSIIIPEGVTTIGDHAFTWCGITNITIPNSVTSIGSYAFYSCSSLTSINVDENNDYYTSINGNLYTKDGKTLIQYAIGKADSEFAIPDGATTISVGAFYDSLSLTSIVIPDSVTTIGDNAFTWCENLTNITIPDSVTTIGSYAFERCYSLTSINVDENNDCYTSINGNLYTKNGKTLIQYAIGKADSEFAIPDGVTTICSYAFFDCRNLTSIIIPGSVTYIGDNAFQNCYGVVFYCEAQSQPEGWIGWSSDYPVVWGYVGE